MKRVHVEQAKIAFGSDSCLAELEKSISTAVFVDTQKSPRVIWHYTGRTGFESTGFMGVRHLGTSARGYASVKTVRKPGPPTGSCEIPTRR